MTPVTLSPTPGAHTAPTAPMAAVAPPNAYLRRFTVAEYHKMIDTGILTEDDSLELIEGWLRYKMPHDPRHDSRLDHMRCAIESLLSPAAWIVRIQSAITLTDSEPEPDIVVAGGPRSNYDDRHPGSAEIGLIVESSNSSLSFDRNEKLQIYAREKIPHYWIINLIVGVVECYSDPTGPDPTPTYRQRQNYRPGDNIHLILAGQSVGDIAVNDLNL